MPVVEHPVHQHGVRDADYRYGCHNRPPFRDTVCVQDGWNDDGTRRVVEIPFRMSRECRYDRSLSDSACAGCHRAGSGEAYVAAQEAAIAG
ncbi:hypothetical protein [Pseudomonas sp.]|uniref:hypothetical protein n=1 Tax=Pseudomonas sp. TaxID=306 RepID=UPI00258933E9|nr:hypothetical protein [Pseudomonas sp.]